MNAANILSLKIDVNTLVVGGLIRKMRKGRKNIGDIRLGWVIRAQSVPACEPARGLMKDVGTTSISGKFNEVEHALPTAISDVYFKGNLFGDARPDDEETTAPGPTDLDEWIGTERDAIGANGVGGRTRERIPTGVGAGTQFKATRDVSVLSPRQSASTISEVRRRTRDLDVTGMGKRKSWLTQLKECGVRERLLMAQISIADAERLLPVTNDYSLEPMPIAQSHSAIHPKRFCQQQRPVEHGVDVFCAGSRVLAWNCFEVVAGLGWLSLTGEAEPETCRRGLEVNDTDKTS
ncbi:hypothetical protein B0H13DRAFT_2539593 [Mycena leptocephala]|nr:hypothetical protein B0H13DRAFT_2539593 [Mycena leptocephala]